MGVANPESTHCAHQTLTRFFLRFLEKRAHGDRTQSRHEALHEASPLDSRVPPCLRLAIIMGVVTGVGLSRVNTQPMLLVVQLRAHALVGREHEEAQLDVAPCRALAQIRRADERRNRAPA